MGMQMPHMLTQMIINQHPVKVGDIRNQPPYVIKKCSEQRVQSGSSGGYLHSLPLLIASLG